MRLSYRLILSLIAGVTAVSLVFVMYQTGAEMQALKDDVERRALVLAESEQAPVEALLQDGSTQRLQAVVDRFRNRGQLAGAAVFDARGQPVAITFGLASRLTAIPKAVELALRGGWGRGEFLKLGGEPMLIFALPLRSDTGVIGAIAILHDVGYFRSRREAIWRHALASVAVQTLLIACITILVVRWTLGKPLRRMAHWLRDLRTGSVSADGAPPEEGIFGPLTSEVTQLATSLNAARAAAQEEARLRDTAQSQWTPERLRIYVQTKLDGSRLFAVSNREPYEHVYRGNSIAWSVPASGLVTALEPVLQA